MNAETKDALAKAIELLKDAIEEIEGLEGLRTQEEKAYRPISNAKAYVAQALAALFALQAVDSQPMRRSLASDSMTTKLPNETEADIQ